MAPPLSACRGSFVQKEGFKCQAGSVGLCRRSDVSLNSSAVLTKTLLLLPPPPTRSKLCRGRAGETNPGVCVQPCPASSPSACFPSRGAEGMQPPQNHLAARFLEACTPVPALTPHRSSPGWSTCSFPASPLPPRSALPFQASDGERGYAPAHAEGWAPGHPATHRLLPGLQQAAAPPAPRSLCRRLRQRRRAALYIGWEAGERGGGPGSAPASSQPKAAQAAPVKIRA